MRKPIHPRIEKGRIVVGRLQSTVKDGYNGAFYLRRKKRNFFCVASDGLGWEHVSVSIEFEPDKTPTWDEMCWIKELFWNDDECVIQYHPAKDDYINFHAGVLHLWRPIELELPKPRLEMV